MVALNGHGMSWLHAWVQKPQKSTYHKTVDSSPVFGDVCVGGNDVHHPSSVHPRSGRPDGRPGVNTSFHRSSCRSPMSQMVSALSENGQEVICKMENGWPLPRPVGPTCSSRGSVNSFATQLRRRVESHLTGSATPAAVSNHFLATSNRCIVTSNKCIATSSFLIASCH